MSPLSLSLRARATRRPIWMTSLSVAFAVSASAAGQSLTPTFSTNRDASEQGASQQGTSQPGALQCVPTLPPLWPRSVVPVPKESGSLTDVHTTHDPLGNTYLVAQGTGTLNLGGSELHADAVGDLVVAKFDPLGQHVFSRLYPENNADVDCPGGDPSAGSGQQIPLGVKFIPESGRLRIPFLSDRSLRFTPTCCAAVEFGTRHLVLEVESLAGDYRGATKLPKMADGRGFAEILTPSASYYLGSTSDRVLLTGSTLAPSGGTDLVLLAFTPPPATDATTCVDLSSQKPTRSLRLGAGPGGQFLLPPETQVPDPFRLSTDGLKVAVDHNRRIEGVGNGAVPLDLACLSAVTRFKISTDLSQLLKVNPPDLCRARPQPTLLTPPLATALRPVFNASLLAGDGAGAESSELEPSATPSRARASLGATGPACAVAVPFSAHWAWGSASDTVEVGALPLPGRSVQGEFGYLVALGPEGEALTAGVFDGPGRQVVSRVTRDREGNVFVAGEFETSIDLNALVVPGCKGPGWRAPLLSAGGSDLFVAKFAPSGALLAASRFGGPQGERLEDFSVSPVDGRIMLAGQTEGNLDLGAGPLSAGAFLLQLGGFEFTVPAPLCEPPPPPVCRCTTSGPDACGYDPQGFNARGLDRQGYDRAGFKCTGSVCLDRQGYDRTGFKCSGAVCVDRQGYDRLGLDCRGYDRLGIRRYRGSCQ
jgi:hypothetical protein